MADTTTTNYGWTKPEVGASSDTWGGKTNDNWDGVDTTVKAVSDVADAALPKAGGTMTGALTNASGFIGPLTGNVTGNASTATALTSGNKTINGSLALNGPLTVQADTNFGLHATASIYILQLGATNGINLDTSTGRMNIVVGSVTVGYFDATGWHQVV